jgi:hypothetical protein
MLSEFWFKSAAAFAVSCLDVVALTTSVQIIIQAETLNKVHIIQTFTSSFPHKGYQQQQERTKQLQPGLLIRIDEEYNKINHFGYPETSC